MCQKHTAMITYVVRLKNKIKFKHAIQPSQKLISHLSLLDYSLYNPVRIKRIKVDVIAVNTVIMILNNNVFLLTTDHRRMKNCAAESVK